MIRALMVSTSFPASSSDWRGVFIRWLAESIAGNDSISLQLWAPPGEVHPSVEVVTTTEEREFLQALMNSGGIAHLLRNITPAKILVPFTLLKGLRASYKRAVDVDLYHVNWLQNAIVIPNDKKPLIASVLGSDLKLSSFPLVKRILRNVFKKRRTILCPNSKWMVEPLKDLFGDVAEIIYCPFGIDERWLNIERTLDNGSSVNSWIAVTRVTKRKIGDLFNWGEGYFNSGDRTLHLFGPMQEQIDLPRWVVYHGPASAKELASEWFPKAIGLISLSQHSEGLPQVMLEAQASGVPIIASNLPAHTEIIAHQKTGWLCKSKEDFGAGLTYLEEEINNAAISQLAKSNVLKDFGNWDDCAARYVSLYQKLLRG
jgi:glycosyltransferase involved in cell wall biosynthesis